VHSRDGSERLAVIEIVMPQFGETVEEEITISKWFKEIGDPIEAGQVLVEVETDKATLSVEAADSGRLVQIVKDAGEVVKPGIVIGYLEN
jgi:pyruvate/2-oxoglutarate dehydrogenase complex dihydrolipoamide acyltransferase (E2) component